MLAIPTIGYAEVPRLVGALIRSAVVREGAGAGFAHWIWRTTARLGSPDFFLVLGRRRFLLVTGDSLTAFILDKPPSPEHFVTGTLKARAMSFLAPNALTILDGAAWTAMRQFNETVLAGADLPETKALIRAAVSAQFATPVTDIVDLRRRMGRVMLDVVLGPTADAGLADDIHELFAEVNARTALFGSRKAGRRDRFKSALLQAWQRGTTGSTLLARAQRVAGQVPAPYDGESILVDQIPHWMFTFTDSGTALVGRTLAMLRARPTCRRRAQRDLEAADARFLVACILETGRLFPPVGLISHTSAKDVRFGETIIPAGTTILQFLPARHRARSEYRDPGRFRPERFLDPQEPNDPPRVLTFLSGARACPGRDLVVFVATEILARQIQMIEDGSGIHVLATDPLPLRFPRLS